MVSVLAKKLKLDIYVDKDTNINLAKIIPVVNKTDNKSEIGISMDMIGTAKLPFFSAILGRVAV